MSACNAELLAVLNEQLTVLDDLVELGLAETSAFKIDDVAQIASIVERQKDAVDRMRVLERRKADILCSHSETEMPAENRIESKVHILENILSCLIEQARRLQEYQRDQPICWHECPWHIPG